MNARLDSLRKTFVGSRPWKCCLKRAILSPTFVTITNVADNGSGYFRITAASHGFNTGDAIVVENITGMPTLCVANLVVTRIDANTLDVQTIAYAGTYSGGGRLAASALFDFNYKLAIPTDWVRTLLVNDDIHGYEWRNEGSYILTTSYPVNLIYIFDQTDYTAMPSTMYDALGAFIAARLSYKLTQSTELREMLNKESYSASTRAAFYDSTQDPAKQVEATEWQDSRIAGILPFATDPMT